MKEDKWPYLREEAYKSRYAVAAYFLRDCSTIIEIGGSRGSSTIDNFVKKKNIVICDPLLENEKMGDVTYIKGVYQDVDFSKYDRDYGLCILGLDGQYVSYDAKLKVLIKKAKRTVIEYPPIYKKSIPVINEIINDNKIIIDMDLNFERTVNKTLLTLSWPQRRLIVLE